MSHLPTPLNKLVELFHVKNNRKLFGVKGVGLSLKEEETIRCQGTVF